MINDDLKAFFEKEPQFQTARELANILLRHFNKTEQTRRLKEEDINETLERIDIKWYSCPIHGKRVGCFYLCDACHKEAKCQDTK